MDPLGDPLTTCPNQMGLEISFKPCPNWRFGCMDHPDRQFVNGSVLTRTRIWIDCLEPLLTLSSTECYFVSQISCYLVKFHIIFTLIYFRLHSPTSLHLHQHGTYGQPGEESLFTEESKSTPWESTCRCIKEDSQSSLPIKCLNFQPSLRVNL